MALSVVLAGVTKTPLVDTLDIQFTLNGRNTATLSIFDEAGTYVPAEGFDVAVNDEGTKIYGGSIDEVKKRLAKVSSIPIYHDILCVGHERLLDKRLTFDANTNKVPVWKSYSGTVDVDGVDVAWKTGDYFDIDLIGKESIIDGNPFTVDNVDSNPIAFTLTASAGTLTDAEWSFTWTAGAIVTDLITNYATFEGITLGTIEDGADIPKLIGNYRRIDEVLDELAQLSGFVWWIDPQKVLYFVARETTAAPFNISDISKILDISVRGTREDYRNIEAIRASFSGFGITSQSFSGDDSIQAWLLDDRVDSIESMTVNGAIVSFGVAGVDADKDFYFGIGERVIQQDLSAVKLTASDALVVNYRILGGDVITWTDDAEVDARALAEPDTSGRYVHFTDDSQNADANGVLEKATSLVERYKVMPQVLNYRTCAALEPLAPLLQPGQLQSIVITKLGVNATYLISQVRAHSQGALNVAGDRVLWYEVEAVTGTYLNNFLTTFKLFIGGSGSSSVTAAGSPGGSQSASLVISYA